MNLPFIYLTEGAVMMLLLVVLPLYLIGIAIVRAMLRWAGATPKEIRWITRISFWVVLFFATFDSFLATRYLKEQCELDGGLVVHRTDRTKGIYAPSLDRDPLLDILLNAGFQFVETDTDDDGYQRHTLAEDGSVRVEPIDVLQSRYLRNTDMSVPVLTLHGLTIAVNHAYVKDRTDSTMIAEFKDYYVKGTWIDNALNSLPGGALHCKELFSNVPHYSRTNHPYLLNALEPEL